jgi:OHCU decarboxylase
MNVESMYEYGSRAGVWRLWRMFTDRKLPVTVFGVATALARCPDAVAAMREARWEIASHGLKWIDYKDVPEAQERADLAEAIRIHTAAIGERPLGWYTGRGSVNTLPAVLDEGGFLYSSDSYADDLPYWVNGSKGPHLIIPYTLDANDMRFATPQGFNSGDQFFAYLRDAFDTLYEEGRSGRPRIMNIGLHCRLVGRPGRAAALKRFIDYVKTHDKVWLARRIDIARHWRENHPYEPAALRPSRMTHEEFVAQFGGIFEHSAWIAERAYELELGPAHDSAGGLHNALCRMFRGASETERLGVLNAHPDLAGRLAAAKRLTRESAREQASAGLDALTDKERELFSKLNAAYVTTFGFPFIIAVKGKTKEEILAAFERRIGNDRATELNTACGEVERIALLRLKDLLPV